MLSMTDARNCVPRMFRYWLIVGSFVSACKCSIGVVCVLPSVILSAVFSIVCNLFSCVFESDGCQDGLE